MTETKAIAVLIAVILYVLMPWDAVPDFMPLVGWIDDLLVAIVTASIVYNRMKSQKKGPEVRTEEAKRHVNGDKTADPGDPHEILGVARGADREEIRKAYRERMAEYHPDKVAHLGPDLRKLAHEKSVAIQRAYKELLPDG